MILLLDLFTSIRLLLLNLFDALVAISDIFGDEEGSFFMLLGHLHVSSSWVDEPHLWMTRWCEHFLCLCLFGELSWENLTLNVSIRTDVGNLQWDTLSHDFSVQVVTLDLLLDFSWKQFDWVRIRPLTGLIGLSLSVAFIINQVLVIYHHCWQILL